MRATDNEERPKWPQCTAHPRATPKVRLMNNFGLNHPGSRARLKARE